MKGDRVEVVVDTGQGAQRFEIVATRAGRRLEVTTARGVVEVSEVTRGGTTVRTGRFMASRLIALVEHPALEETGVDVTTRRRIGGDEAARRGARPPADGTDGSRRGQRPSEPQPVDVERIVAEEAETPDPVDELRSAEQRRRRA